MAARIHAILELSRICQLKTKNLFFVVYSLEYVCCNGICFCRYVFCESLHRYTTLRQMSPYNQIILLADFTYVSTFCTVFFCRDRLAVAVISCRFVRKRNNFNVLVLRQNYYYFYYYHYYYVTILKMRPPFLEKKTINLYIIIFVLLKKRHILRMHSGKLFCRTGP